MRSQPSSLDVESSDVLTGEDEAVASCCRLLRILIDRRLDFILWKGEVGICW